MRFLLLRLVLLVLFLTPPIDTRRSEQAATDYDEISANRADLEKKSSMDDIVEAKALVKVGEKPESAMIANQTNLTYYDFSGKMNRYKRSIEVMKKEIANANKEIADKKKELEKTSKSFTQADDNFLSPKMYNEKIVPYNEAKRKFETANATHERLNKEYTELQMEYDKVVNMKTEAQKNVAEANMKLEEWSFLNDIKDVSDPKVKKEKVQTFVAKRKKIKEELKNLATAKGEYDQLESCIKDPVNIVEFIPAECKKKWKEVKLIENNLKENKYMDIENNEYTKIELWLDPTLLDKAVSGAIQSNWNKEEEKLKNAEKEVKKAVDKIIKKGPYLREIYHKELEVWKWRIEAVKNQEEMVKHTVDGDKSEYEQPRRLKAEIEELENHVKSMQGLIGKKETAMENEKRIFEKRKARMEELLPNALHFSFYGCVGLVLLLPVIIFTIIVLCTRKLSARGPKHWGKYYVKLRKRNFRHLSTKERAFQGKKVGRKFFYPLWPWEIANTMKFKLNATKTTATYKRLKNNWDRGFFGMDRTGPNPYHFDPIDPPRISWDPPESKDPKDPGQEIEGNEKFSVPVYPLKQKAIDVLEKEFLSFYYFHLHARHNRRMKARLKYRLFLHKMGHKKLYQGKPHKTVEKKEKEKEELRKNEKEPKKEKKNERKKEWMQWEKTTMRGLIKGPDGKAIKMPRNPVTHKNFTKMLYLKYQMELNKMMHGEHHSYLLRKAKKRYRKHVRELMEKAHSGCVSPQSAKKKHRKRYKMKRRHRKRAKKNAKSVKEKEEVRTQRREEGKGEEKRKKSPKKARKRDQRSAKEPGSEVKIPDAVDKEDSTKGKPEAAPVLILHDDPKEQKTQENTRVLSAFGVPYLEEDKTQPATAKTGLMGDTDQRLRRQKQIRKTGEDDETQATKTGPYFDAKSSLAVGGGKKSQKTDRKFRV